jgi:hypothetical protein
MVDCQPQAIRTDMDALPVTANWSSFASTVTSEYNGKPTGVMVPAATTVTAMVLGAAEVLWR